MRHTVQTRRLVQYPLPTRHIPAEAVLELRLQRVNKLTAVSFALAIMAWVGLFINMLLNATYKFDSFARGISLISLVAVTALPILCTAIGKATSRLLDYYTSVPQGMVAHKVSESEYDHYVIVKGYNLLNQLRTEKHPMNRRRWRDIKIGEYIDFRELR